MSIEVKDNARELSPFLDQLCARHPDWLTELQTSGRLHRASEPAADQLERQINRDGLDTGLRRFRNREMMRIIWRDLTDLAPLKETLADLSALAATCLQAAVDHHSETLEEQYGIPRDSDGRAQKLVVIGLGKLGGFELNMSSDIDIIFCFPESGVCDGRRGLANEQFFTRLARKVIRSLSEITADGFCFRVDTRLRPFGDSGPLVSSFAALEQYYQREGRDWERYALIKARPIAGDLVAGKRLLGLLKPFVYRRYIDFGAIDAMREMYENVRADALRSDRLDDIKRGPGGIREIEFLVQAFQLLRGGREPALQTPSLMTAANVLKELQLLPVEVASELLQNYHFLRKTENCIQALHDQQTHKIPGGEDGFRVARAMGFESTEDFQSALGKTRARVQQSFKQSLPQMPESTKARSRWQALWQNSRRSEPEATLEFRNPKPLKDFIKRLERLSLSQRAARRLDQFIPLLLEKIDGLGLDDAVVDRVFDLISAICRRSAYLSLLVQNNDATDRMLDLFAASKQVAQSVTRYPALLDELIDPRLGAAPPDKADIQTSVQRILNTHADTEVTLQNLNYLKQAVSLRIGVAILHSTLSALEAQNSLSQLAECLIQAMLELAQLEVQARHGHLPGPCLVVIAYGSLGARTLKFDSDLDLIFLYQSSASLSDGARPVTAERYHTAVARRMLNLLSATTASGRLYSIDARLRPNGRSGLLVSSVDAFTRYQLEKAWVWELQSLTRARPIAGSNEVEGLFDHARRQALTTERDSALVSREVAAMRERLRNEHGHGDPLKHAPGGLLDIEFVVQLGLLLNARSCPDVIKSTMVGEQLIALRDCGWMNGETYESLARAYEQLSRGRQRSGLVDDSSEIDISSLLETARPVCEQILGAAAQQTC